MSESVPVDTAAAAATSAAADPEPPPLPEEVLGPPKPSSEKNDAPAETPADDDDTPPILIIEEDAEDQGPPLPPEAEFVAAPPVRELEEYEQRRKPKLHHHKSKQRLRESTRTSSLTSFGDPGVSDSPRQDRKASKNTELSQTTPGTSDGHRHHHHHHHHHQNQKAGPDGQTVQKRLSTKSLFVQQAPADNSAQAPSTLSPAEPGALSSSGPSNSAESLSSSSDSEEEWSSDSSSSAAEPTPSKSDPPAPSGVPKFNTLNLGALRAEASSDNPRQAVRHSSMKNIHAAPPVAVRDGSLTSRSLRTPVVASQATPPPLSIRSRTFSNVGDNPFKGGNGTSKIPISDFVKATAKATRSTISEEQLAERTPKASYQASHTRVSPQRKSTRQAIQLTQAASAAAAQQAGAACPPSPMLPTIGVIAAQTPEQLEQYEQTHSELKQKGGQKKMFGTTVEEQAMQPGHDANPDVPPFFISLMAKMRSFGTKGDERSLLQMWELVDKEPTQNLMVEKNQIETGRLRLEGMVIEPRHVIYFLLDYLKSLASPLIGYEAQSLMLPAALAEYDDLELAASILPGIWALHKCEFETLKMLVMTLRELYIVPSRKAMTAAFQIASVIANPLFQATPKDEKLKRAYVRLTSCMLFNGGDLFDAPPQMALKKGPQNEMIIQAASPSFLLETLTNEFYEESSYSLLFLLTYQYYMTHEEMYGILVSHCQKMFGVKENSTWRDNKKALILNAISRWVRVRGSELLVDAPEVIENLKTHFGEARATDKMDVKEFLQESYAHIPTVVMFSESGRETSSQFLLQQLTNNVHTVAEQISLFHQKLFSFIPISELIKKKKPDPDISDSDIFTASFVTSFNKLTRWLISVIVSSEEKKTPVLLTNCVKLAMAMLKLNNFNGAMAVSAALQHPAVERIHDAWEHVPKKQQANMKELSEIFNLNFSKYRPMIASVSPPGVPCLIVIQHDLFGLEENAKTWLPDKGVPNAMINFDKLRMIGEMLQQVKLFQLTPYSFTPMPGIQEVLKDLPTLDDAAVYSRRKALKEN